MHEIHGESIQLHDSLLCMVANKVLDHPQSLQVLAISSSFSHPLNHPFISLSLVFLTFKLDQQAFYQPTLLQ